MRAHEFLTELADKPAEFTTTIDDDYYEMSAPDVGLTLYLTRGLSHTLENDEVHIEFAVNGQYKLTGGGNAIKVFSTVLAMLKSSLNKFIEPGDHFVSFGAEKSEPSRVKLYAKRAVPKVTEILQSVDPKWKFMPYNSFGSLEIYAWERK